MNGDDGLPGMERGSWDWTLVHCSPSYSLGLDQHVDVDDNVGRVDQFDAAMMGMTMWSNLKLTLPAQYFIIDGELDRIDADGDDDRWQCDQTMMIACSI